MDLIERGINVNHRSSKRFTALHFCAMYNCNEIAESLVQRNAKVDYYDRYGNDPLWYAVGESNYKMAKLFVEHGADINHKNKANLSPLDAAKDDNDLEMIKILTHYPANE